MGRKTALTCDVAHLAVCLLLMTRAINGTVKKKYAFVGSNTFLKCFGNSTGLELSVIWTLANGTKFRHGSLSTQRKVEGRFRSSITEDGNGALLEINKVQFEDGGSYKCSKTFVKAGLSENLLFSLQVQDYPNLSVRGGNSTEDVISSECCINMSLNMEDYTIKWLLDEDPNFHAVFQKEKETVSGIKKTLCTLIQFDRNRHYHRKTLECSQRNGHSVIPSVSTQLDVWYAAKVLAGKSMNTSSSTLVGINEEFNITCVADGNPLPVVKLEMLTSRNRWEKAEIQVSQLLEEHQTLWIFRLSGIKNDTIFRCTADNVFDQIAVSDDILIEVMYLKEVKILNKTMKVAKNSDFNISCQTNGKPPPGVYLLRSRDSVDWSKVDITPITVANDGHTSTVNFLLTSEESKIKDYSFKCKAFKNSTNKTVESLAVRLEIHATFFEWVETNLNTIVIVGVGIVVIITIIATGASRRRKSLYNFYNTIRPGNNDAASYNRTDVTATPRPPPPISASIPDLCRLGSSNSSAYDNPKGSVYYDCNDDYDEVHTSSENLDLRSVDSQERRPQRDDASYSLTYKRGVKFEQESNLDVQYSTDHGKFESTFGKDTYSGYDI